jgi:hypothetical protein
MLFESLAGNHMLDQILITAIDTSLVLFGGLIVAVLYAANEMGFCIGRRGARQLTAHERDQAGIGTITAGMLGLLAFTLSLTINVAQNRFELRRGLVVQEANAIEAAWLRSKLIAGEEAPAITTLIEAYAKVQLAYISADTFDVEPKLIAQKTALQTQVWQIVQTVVQEQPSTSTSALATAVVEMFNTAQTERFAFESRVPANMFWMLMGGSLLAIGAMGYHFGASGPRHIVLTSLLLVMWAGGIVLIADLNRPRIGMIRVDPAPLVWTVQTFEQHR